MRLDRQTRAYGAWLHHGLVLVPALALALALASASASAHAAEPRFGHSAPVTVAQAGAFVQLPLPASVYAKALRPDLADLRLLDGRGERVPFAFLPPLPPAPPPANEAWRAVAAWPLPPRPTPAATLGLPVEVTVRGDTIQVRRGSGSTGAAAPTPVPPVPPPGWLFDLGAAGPATPGVLAAPALPRPQTLRLAWPGAPDFSAAYDIDLSDDLRQWRSGGSGQLMSLQAAAGSLEQRSVPLPPAAPRFVRLVWRDPATALRIGAAEALWPTPAAALPANAAAPHAPDSTELRLQAVPDPAGAAPVRMAQTTTAPPSLVFDLGGPMPIASVSLELPPGTRVAPVRLQGRAHLAGPWQDLGTTVFYRIERDGQPTLSPPFETAGATARWIGVLPDDRAAALVPATTALVLRVHLPQLVFVAQGQPPYRLLAGAAVAEPGALPVATLVPQLDTERARLGRAEIGAWSEVPEVAAAARAAARQAALRPWLLWGVLSVGVMALGVMVWRLAKGKI